MPRISFVLALSALLSACASTPSSVITPPAPRPAATPVPTPPMTAPPPQVAPSSGSFVAPRVMQMRGLEDVIGRNGTALANIFGPPRLEVREGDAMKLQWTGEACVLDIYLYPLQPGGEPSATYVDTRRASDGLDVDRVSCVNALRR